MEERVSKFINKKRVFAFESKQELLNFVDQKKGILIALNAEKLNKNDLALDSLINDNYGYPDGIGAVWALKRKGINSIKIPGAEFWLDIIERFKEEKSFYFIGGTESVITQTIKKLQTQFPELKIKGFRNGYLEQGDSEVLKKTFKKKKPDIVFVAMGSPRQEFLMAQFLEAYPALYMGLGGSFDVFSGTKKRAPKFFIKFGLEWFYRLLKEPTRITRQLNLVKFFFKIIFDKL